jgi:hypothetical protein
VYAVKTSEGAGRGARLRGRIGEQSYAECEIRLDVQDLQPERVAHTFLHETLHAISAEYCNDNALGEDDTDAFASGLLQVLKQLGIELVLE